MKLCSVSECGRRAEVRGWCPKHYMRWRTGMPMDDRVRDMARFESKYTTEPNSGCWLWTSYINESGYGATTWHNKRILAHRLAWTLFKGKIPEGLYVLHKCDVPCCVNPDHLYIGTDEQNKMDSITRKRHVYGDRHPDAKLKSVDIPAIREDPRPILEIASDYNVSYRTIYRVKARTSWKHV